jgi:EAL domain-containing protein (putative c-di-GMP-specific phosphodiesterase class I)
MQTILIIDDDPLITEALAQLLEQSGRELILCGDLESAQMVIERMRPACVVTDVRLTSPFRYEGLDFIGDVKRNSPESRIILMTGAHTDELEHEALARGAAAVLTKPFALSELEAYIPAATSSEQSSVVRVPSIDDIVDGSSLVPNFQPIVDLSDKDLAVHGFESLARFHGPFLSMPEALFEYAGRKERIVDLELACLRGTFAHATSLAATAKLFINLHPAVIADARLAEFLTNATSSAGIPPKRVVLEITEQGSLAESGIVERRCGDLRRLGFSFALDDVGMAYSHLTHIEQIRPAYLKVSRHFGTDFQTEVTRTKIVRNVLALARDFGCELILEGIESVESRDAARNFGIRFGQGYLFGRPAPAEHFLGMETIPQPDAESGSPVTGRPAPRHGTLLRKTSS